MLLRGILHPLNQVLLTEKTFWLLSVFLIGGLIAREAALVPYEIVLGLLMFFWGMFFFTGHERNLAPLLKGWMIILGLFFVMSTFPLIVHWVRGQSFDTYLSTRFEINLHLLFIALWTLLAFHLTKNILVIWKSLILSAGWVLWVILVEIWALKGQMGLMDFMTTHRFGDYASTYVIDFGIYSNTLFLFLLGALFWQKQLRLIWRLLLWIALIVSFSGAVLSQSRTAWIGWPEALIGWSIFYGYWFWTHFKGLERRKWGVIVALSIALIGVGVSLSGMFSIIEKRVELAIQDVQKYAAGTPDSSVGHRFVMYEAGWQSVMENPLWGVGPNGFKAEIQSQTQKVFKERFNKENAQLSYGNIHNQFLMSAMQQGIFGVLAVVLVFLFLFYAFFIRKPREDVWAQKSLRYTGAILTVASLLVFMPQTPLYDRTEFLYFFLMMSLALVMVAVGEKEREACKK